MELSAILSGRDKQLYHLSGKDLEGNYRLMIDVQLSMSSSYDEKGKSLITLKTKEVTLPAMMNALMAILHLHDVDFRFEDECIIFIHRLDEHIKCPTGNEIRKLRVYMLGSSEMSPLIKPKAEYHEVYDQRLVDLVDTLEDWRFQIPQYILISYQIIDKDKTTKVVRMYPVSKISQKKLTILQRQKQSDRDKAEDLKKKIEKQRIALASYKDKLLMIENPRQADKEFFGHELEENTYTISLD